MSISLKCAAGHEWEAPDPGDTLAPLPSCPVCAKPAQVPTAATTSVIIQDMPVGSWPHLGKQPRRTADPNATIEAVPGQSVPVDSYDFEVTLPTGELGAALRESIPGYEILSELGRGGMGVVYKARHHGLNRLVALKMLLSGVHLSGRELQRFRREAAAVAGLHHPHIVQIYEIGEHGGRPYFSLEYIEGGSLHHKLKGQPLPARDSAATIEKLARAIHYAHLRGLVHRDLKPANILLTLDGLPKITDFGLAKHLHAGSQHTQTGTVMGTPSYMAPEQAMGHSRDVGPGADVYALGAILYEMLCGQPPFRSETPLDTMLQVASRDPTPLSRLQPSVPQDLGTICMKCLEKEPHKRYTTALELAGDLQRFLEGEPIQARPVGTIERTYKWARRRPALAGLIVLGAFTVVAGFSGMTWLWKVEADRNTRIQQAQTEMAAALVRAENSLYGNRIALAEREWLASNIGRARMLLRECKPELRSWEWHYLNRLCHADLLTLRGHDAPIYSLSFSPDGQHILSASSDQAVKVWDGVNGKLQHTHFGSSGRDRSAGAVFSLDGRHVLYAGGGPVLHTWDVKTGQEVHTGKRPAAKVFCTTYSPDRRRLAGGGLDGVVTIWDLATDKEVTLKGHAGVVQSLAFDPRGRYLASAGQDGNVRIWDTSSGNLIRTIAAHSSPVTQVAYSPEGFRVVSTGADSTVRVWEALSGKALAIFRGHHQPVTCAAFSPNGKTVATAGRDQVVRVWNAATGEEMYSFRGHTDRINCIAFRRDGKLLATAGEDRVVKVWDAGTGQEARSFRSRFAGSCVAYAPDGLRLATADTHVQMWEATTSRPLESFGGEGEIIRGLAFHPDSQSVLTAGSVLARRDARTGRLLNAYAVPGTAHHRSAAFSPDGGLIVSGGDDGLVRVWETASGKLLHTLSGHEGSVLAVAFHPDGGEIASASTDRSVKIWEPRGGRLVRSLAGHSGRVNSIAYSPNGRWLATGGEGQVPIDEDSPGLDGELKIWEAATGELRHSLWGHSGAINTVIFSPDSNRLASGSEDQTVKLWAAEFGQEVLTLRGHNNAVHGVSFSPDGHSLASVALDQTVRIWNATPLQ